MAYHNTSSIYRSNVLLKKQIVGLAFFFREQFKVISVEKMPNDEQSVYSLP